MQHEIEGFKILMMHDVRVGMVINYKTIEDLPLIECGTWISDDGNWMIRLDTPPHDIQPPRYRLYPHTDKVQTLFFEHYSKVTGALDYVLAVYQMLKSKVK